MRRIPFKFIFTVLASLLLTSSAQAKSLEFFSSSWHNQCDDRPESFCAYWYFGEGFPYSNTRPDSPVIKLVEKTVVDDKVIAEYTSTERPTKGMSHAYYGIYKSETENSQASITAYCNNQEIPNCSIHPTRDDLIELKHYAFELHYNADTKEVTCIPH